VNQVAYRLVCLSVCPSVRLSVCLSVCSAVYSVVFGCLSVCLTVQRCIELVSRAKRPVMLIGSQATLPPCSTDELRQAVEVWHVSSCLSMCLYLM